MKLAALMIGVSMALAAPAAATVVTVESTAGPWDVVANPTLDYGAFDSTGPTAIAVNAGLQPFPRPPHRAKPRP